MQVLEQGKIDSELEMALEQRQALCAATWPSEKKFFSFVAARTQQALFVFKVSPRILEWEIPVCLYEIPRC
jgi:hypothetical protein